MGYQKIGVWLSLGAMGLGAVSAVPAYAAPSVNTVAVAKAAMPLQQTSQEVQKALLDAYAKINQQTDALQIKEVSFTQTGLFSAKQVVSVKMGCDAAAAAPKKRAKGKKNTAQATTKAEMVMLEHTIDYGPSALLSKGKLAKAVVQTRVLLSAAQRKDLEKEMGETFANSPTQIETILNLDNSLEVLIEEKAFNVTKKASKKGGQSYFFDAQGAKAHVKLNPDTMMGQMEVWVNPTWLSPDSLTQKTAAPGLKPQQGIAWSGGHFVLSNDPVAGLTVKGEMHPYTAFMDEPEKKIKTYTGKGKRRKAQIETIPAKRMDLQVGAGALLFNLDAQNFRPTVMTFKHEGGAMDLQHGSALRTQVEPLEYHYTAQAPDYIVGKAALTWLGAKTFTGEDTQKPIVNIGLLEILAETARNGLYFDSSASFKAAALDVKGMNMGPFTVKASMNHVLAEPFKALYQDMPYSDMLNGINPLAQNVCAPKDTAKPLFDAALMKVLAIYERYNQRSADSWKQVVLDAPVFSYDQVELQFPEGKINFTGKISTQNLQKLDLDRLDEKQPETWRGLVNSLVGNYQFSIDDALAYAFAEKMGLPKKTLDDKLKELIDGGWLARANNQVQSVGTLAQSKWLSNGVDKSALIEDILKPRPVYEEPVEAGPAVEAEDAAMAAAPPKKAPKASKKPKRRK